MCITLNEGVKMKFSRVSVCVKAFDIFSGSVNGELA